MNSDESVFKSAEYKKCYVAFLDMLGFSNICKHKSMPCNDVLKILSFNSVINNSIIENVENNKVAKQFFPKEMTESIYYSIMSDSIFIATPDNKSGLQYILQICCIIQNYLLENSILLRGGISKGEFYGFEDIAFGPALIDAHYIEEKIAIYPRIILSNGVLNDIDAENSIYAKLLYNQSKDDSLCYVNHLNPLELLRMDSTPEKLRKIQNFIEEGCHNTNSKIRIKYHWVKNYYESSLQAYKSFFSSEEDVKRFIEDFTKFI